MRSIHIIMLTVMVLFAALMPANAGSFERVAKNGVLRCGYFVWPPYFMKDPNSGQLSGINYDQTETMAKLLDLKVEWVAEIGAGEVVSALNSGKIDIMCTSLWPDPARMKLLTLTKPLFFTPAYAYVRAGDKKFSGKHISLNQSDVKFAGIEGDLTYSVVKNNFPKAKLLALPQNADPAQLLLNLTSGKADVVVMDEAFARDYAKTNPGKIQKLSDVGAIQVYPESFAIQQGEAQFKNMLDAAIETIVSSGQSKEILSRYEHYSFAPKPGF